MIYKFKIDGKIIFGVIVSDINYTDTYQIITLLDLLNPFNTINVEKCEFYKGLITIYDVNDKELLDDMMVEQL